MASGLRRADLHDHRAGGIVIAPEKIVEDDPALSAYRAFLKHEKRYGGKDSGSITLGVGK